MLNFSSLHTHTHIQVILAREVGLGVPMASFGWALSGGLDVDGNQYPDLLVGATHANAAVVLK